MELEVPKTASADEAVAEFVESGMCVHFSLTHNRSHVLANALARRFRDAESLRLIGTGFLEYAATLAGAGALASVEGAFAGNSYPLPGPSAALQSVVEDPASDPHWSNLTMTLRLMAGALGMPAIPTTSLAGTDLWNGAGRERIGSPFGAIDLIAAARPDVAFLHAAMADQDGNAIVYGPFGEDLWGAWAAERVVVSAEKIVDRQDLLAGAPHVGFPGARVDVVVPARFGAHPQGQYIWDSGNGLVSYRDDYEFRRAFRKATRDPGAFQRWLDDWTFNCDHDAYLEKLGSGRLQHLTADRSIVSSPSDMTIDDSTSGEAKRNERAATVAARMIRDRAGNYASIVCGIGLSHLAAWLAARISGGGPFPALVAETGLYDFLPNSDDPYLFSYENSAAAVIHSGYIQMLAALAGPRARSSLAVMAAGEVDQYGNLNSSLDTQGHFIVGSGGANDLCSAASDVLIVTRMARQRLVPNVAFTTSRPKRLIGVATDAGLLERDHEGELILTSVVAEPGKEAEVVRDAIQRCGWGLRVRSKLERLDPPTGFEKGILRTYSRVL